jgi:CheY-like chemotaxis protein
MDLCTLQVDPPHDSDDADHAAGEGVPPVGHVLVADDNPLSLAFFSAAITTAGYSVETASDGFGALARAGGTRFDLMLIDHRMPGLDGPQTLRAIRSADNASRSTPALATTADSALSAEHMLADGFDGVLFKPVGVRELLVAIRPYLEIAQGENDPIAVLDDTLARERSGGDASIVIALRGLLAGELDALPGELQRLRQASDSAGIRDRLHRLEASAGFCGTPALTRAIAELRRDCEREPCGSERIVERFLCVCADTRNALD